MRDLLCCLLLMFSLSAGAMEDSLLERLDSVVAGRHGYESEIRENIARTLADYESASTDLDRYNVLRGLYEQYRSFRIDSAIIIADERLRLARKLGDKSKIASASINVAEAYAKAGEADRSILVLDTLPESDLMDYHRKYRNSVYRNAYGLKYATSLLASDRDEALRRSREFRQQAYNESPSDSRGHYTLEAERLRDAGEYDRAVALMEEADRRFDFSGDAGLLYTMGETYLAAGRREEAKNCLARSALLDISSGTKEYRSLILLASVLFEDGQIDRSFDYINCAFEDAAFSRASLRTAEIMKSMPIIDRAYHEAEQTVARRTSKFLIIVSVLAVLLLLSLVMTIRAFRQNKRMLGVIELINGKLEEKNVMLVEADSLKLRNITMLTKAYASHMERLRDFRKSVYRMLASSQYEKAMDAVKYDTADARDISDFHEMFDELFLLMFPEFVDEVNRFMVTPVELKTPGRLTAELRLIAMMRLGITGTDEITCIFRYSVQTVYNLRSTIKKMIKVPWVEFAAYFTGS